MAWRASYLSLLLCGAGVALLSVGALEIYTPSDDFDQFAYGVFPMKLESSDITCEDVNYKYIPSRRLGSLRGQHNAEVYGGCPFPHHPCARVSCALESQRKLKGALNNDCHCSPGARQIMFLNTFPIPKDNYRTRANLTFNGRKILENVTTGLWTLSNELDLTDFDGVTTVNIELANGMQHAWREYSGDDLPSKWLSAYHSFDDDDMPAALRDTLGTSILQRSSIGGLMDENVDFTFYTSFNDLVRRYKPDNPTQPTPQPTVTLQPSSIPTLIPSIAPTQNYGEKTSPPTMMPSTRPSVVPTMVPTGQPSSLPSSTPTNVPTWTKSPTTVYPTHIPTAYPTYKAPPLTHPYLLMVGDGPYATMYGFNQSLMDDMTTRGTVMVITTTVMSNMTINVGDFDCVGYEAMRPAPNTGSPSMAPTQLKTTVVNRTYDLSYCRRNRAVLCIRNATSSQRIPISNVSFMDLSYIFIGNGIQDLGYLTGEMTLHTLDDVFPTSNPTPIPTFHPTSKPTSKPTEGKQKDPPSPTMFPTQPSAVPTESPTPFPAEVCAVEV